MKHDRGDLLDATIIVIGYALIGVGALVVVGVITWEVYGALGLVPTVVIAVGVYLVVRFAMGVARALLERGWL